MEECEFLGEESLNYLKLQKDKNENIRLYELDAFSFMMMDLDEMEKKIHSTPNDKKGKAGEPTITAGMIQSALHAEKEREEAERKAWFVENFDSLTLLDIYASEWIGEIRRSDKVDYSTGARRRTGTAEKEDVDGDGREVKAQYSGLCVR